MLLGSSAFGFVPLNRNQLPKSFLLNHSAFLLKPLPRNHKSTQSLRSICSPLTWHVFDQTPRLPKRASTDDVKIRTSRPEDSPKTTSGNFKKPTLHSDFVTDHNSVENRLILLCREKKTNEVWEIVTRIHQGDSRYFLSPSTYTTLFLSFRKESPINALKVLHWAHQSGHSLPTLCYNQMLKDLLSGTFSTFYSPRSLESLAWFVFQSMLLHGTSPDAITFNLLARLSTRITHWKHCMHFINLMQKHHTSPNLFVYTTLLHLLTKKTPMSPTQLSSQIENVRRLRNHMKQENISPNVYFQNTLLSFMAHRVNFVSLLDQVWPTLFQPGLVTPDAISYDICYQKAKEEGQMHTWAQWIRLAEKEDSIPENIRNRFHQAEFRPGCPFSLVLKKSVNILVEPRKSNPSFQITIQNNITNGVALCQLARWYAQRGEWQKGCRLVKAAMDHLEEWGNYHQSLLPSPPRHHHFHSSQRFLTLLIQFLIESPTLLKDSCYYLDYVVSKVTISQTEPMDTVLAQQVLSLCRNIFQRKDKKFRDQAWMLSKQLIPSRVLFPDRKLLRCLILFWRKRKQKKYLLKWEEYIQKQFSR